MIFFSKILNVLLVEAVDDEAVVEAVQRGIRSRLYVRGRYSPTREQGVHHFHRLFAAAMNGSPVGES